MLPSDLCLLARGWLHGNCLLSRSGQVIDTGYHTGLRELWGAMQAHGTGALEEILLTHVHSDHSGGVAELVRRSGARVLAHADARALTDPWSPRGLWLGPTGQHLPPFTVDQVLGHEVAFAGRRWAVLHTPGHATGGVSFFCEDEGVLVCGDALWEDGLGVLDPWVDGEQVFDQAWLALDRLEQTRARVVVPGHGPAFADLAGALERARSRVERWQTDRAALLRQVMRSGFGFWLLLHPDADPVEREARRRAMLAAHPLD